MSLPFVLAICVSILNYYEIKVNQSHTKSIRDYQQMVVRKNVHIIL